VTLTFEVSTQTSSQYGDRFCNSCKIKLQITKLLGGYDFAARSCCDLDLQGSDPNLAGNTSSQCGDNLREIVVKSDFK